MGRVVIPGFRKIETSGGGQGGTTNYEELSNKPSINNVPLVGKLNTVNLKLTDATLTEEGVPAEAKVVGEKIAEQSTSLTALSGQLGSHTVKSDVPENAVFTDTVYDDTEVKESISQQSREIQNAVDEINSNLSQLSYNVGEKCVTVSVSDQLYPLKVPSGKTLVVKATDKELSREIVMDVDVSYVSFTNNDTRINVYDSNKQFIDFWTFNSSVPLKMSCKEENLWEEVYEINESLDGLEKDVLTLQDVSLKSGVYDGDSGIYENTGMYKCSNDFIEISPNTPIKLQLNTDNDDFSLLFYDEYKNYLGRSVSFFGTSCNMIGGVTPQNAYYTTISVMLHNGSLPTVSLYTTKIGKAVNQLKNDLSDLFTTCDVLASNTGETTGVQLEPSNPISSYKLILLVVKGYGESGAYTFDTKMIPAVLFYDLNFIYMNDSQVKVRYYDSKILITNSGNSAVLVYGIK